MFSERKERLLSLKAAADRLSEARRFARLKFKEEKAQLAAAEEAVTDAVEAQRITQLVSASLQQKAHERISVVVSRCLSSVFDEPYQFKILFEQKRGRTEARLVFMDGTNEVDPLSASGGGVVDVAAFALRLSALLLSRPARRRVLIADEPFRFVSAEYRERVRMMLEELSRELGVQFILVTHIEELKTGTVVEL